MTLAMHLATSVSAPPSSLNLGSAPAAGPEATQLCTIQQNAIRRSRHASAAEAVWGQVEAELQALGLSQEAAQGVLSLTKMSSLEQLEAALPGHEACQELRRLFELAQVCSWTSNLLQAWRRRIAGSWICFRFDAGV